MHRVYKATGIIIKRINYGEADKIVTIFTKEYGKIQSLAKGIRKIHSKKASQLELFSYVKVNLTKGKFLDIVTEVEAQELFPKIRSNLRNIVYAYELIEIIDQLCPEQEVHKKIFDLSLETLRTLDGGKHKDIALLLEKFTLQVIWELGFLPYDRVLTGNSLDRFLESIVERSIKSKKLINKILDS